jgi:MarR family transcriptional regulator, transcriptional regulator for hemolysin
MTTPRALPIGLHLHQASRIIGQAFDEALSAAGGSLPVWLVLLNLRASRPANQRALAGAVGIGEATLTHHLNAMERQGLVTRVRDPANRRVHVVALTAEGEQLFLRLRQAAVAFDRRLNQGVSAEDRTRLADLLNRLVSNVGDDALVAAPWADARPPRVTRGPQSEPDGNTEKGEH